MKPALLIASFLFLLLSCDAQTPVPRSVRLDATHLMLLLDSAAASKQILLDPYDHYFEQVRVGEMTIQMKKEVPEGTTSEYLLPFYKEFLQSDMADFDEKEAKFTVEVMEKAFKTCMEIAPNLFPDTLFLIKTKGRHYGNSVYYTRGKSIVIPANELASKKRDNFTMTMYHELFHVYSRLHPEKRRQLYQLIGFEHIGVAQLDIPKGLSERVLFNPDGVDFGQKINLATPEGKTITAIPIIFANQPAYARGQEEFFSYLEFHLFEIQPADKGRWKVIVAEDGYSSTLQMDKLPDFFQQIRDNTGYIIHPDEIMADNFSFIMRNQNSPNYTAKFSAPGKALLKSIEEILLAH
jgi:hypothetical protein